MFARSSINRLNHHHRPSFTLVELMISIAIIGVMAGMVLYTLAGAQQDALRNKTRVTIDKINAVILERWEGYRYRSVKLPPNLVEAFKNKQITPRIVASVRTLFLKDTMRMEMPDNYLDLAYTPTSYNLNASIDFNNSPGREYNILRNYFRMGMVPESHVPEILFPATKPSPHWSDSNASAECLYAIVAHSTSGGGSALEAFGPSEIGDVDKDGHPEFIDAWGTPISWIRWPAGYESELNKSYRATSPDAFDPLRLAVEWGSTPTPWTVVPLVVSAGPDRQLGIALNNNPFATFGSIFFPNIQEPTVGSTLASPAAFYRVDNVSSHDLLLE